MSALQDKHLPAPPDLEMPSPPDGYSTKCLQVSINTVEQAIQSLNPGLVAGPDSCTCRTPRLSLPLHPLLGRREDETTQESSSRSNQVWCSPVWIFSEAGREGGREGGREEEGERERRKEGGEGRRREGGRRGGRKEEGGRERKRERGEEKGGREGGRGGRREGRGGRRE